MELRGGFTRYGFFRRQDAGIAEEFVPKIGVSMCEDEPGLVHEASQSHHPLLNPPPGLSGPFVDYYGNDALVTGLQCSSFAIGEFFACVASTSDPTVYRGVLSPVQPIHSVIRICPVGGTNISWPPSVTIAPQEFLKLACTLTGRSPHP
jgi:hypothetical protein